MKMGAVDPRSLADAYAGRRVLVTGPGFKGSWLCEWLLALDADVSGLALPPPQPIFMRLRLARSKTMNVKSGRANFCEPNEQPFPH